MDAANRIMVAVGFTEYTEELLGYAAGIADRIGAEMIVVNIINRRLQLVGN